MTGRRRFSGRERAALYLAADGKCAGCGRDLEPRFHADHVTPYSKGGATHVTNGQALCPECNLRKGAAMVRQVQLSRQWQRVALEKYQQSGSATFVLNVCPAAGKTRFALAVAADLLASGTVRRIVVVVPTRPLIEQWIDAAHQDAGIELAPFANRDGREKKAYNGAVVTYQQVVSNALVHERECARERTLVILDEGHHMGDGEKWGEQMKEAFGTAGLRLLLTGTLFRPMPGSVIPFVRYDTDGFAEADHTYTFGEAVADRVCRRVDFLTYDGDVGWIDGGERIATRLGSDLDAEDEGIALASAYQPGGQYIRDQLVLAHEQLISMHDELGRLGVRQAPAGMLVATDQHAARRYVRDVREVTGCEPVLVISDEPASDDRIRAFRKSSEPWLVAVAKVSEGVDIPRLRVGVWATKVRAPLRFRQIVGRFARHTDDGPPAIMFLPNLQVLRDQARTVYEEYKQASEQASEAYERESKLAADSGPALNVRIATSPGPAEFAEHIAGGVGITGAYAQAQELCRDAGIDLSRARPLAEAMERRGLTGTVTWEGTVTPHAGSDARHRLELNEYDKCLANAKHLAYQLKGRDGDFRETIRSIYRRLARETGALPAQADLDQLRHANDLLEQWLSGSGN